MIGVDLIGQIRRAYFEQHRSIKEIVRTLSVSRATVRKVIRGHKTEFKYARLIQPTPTLGDWVEVLTEILEKEREGLSQTLSSCYAPLRDRLPAPCKSDSPPTCLAFGREEENRHEREQRNSL